MIIIPITPQDERDMASFVECWSDYFGRFAIPAWLLAGAMAFGMQIAFGVCFLSLTVGWPPEGFDWVMLGLLAFWSFGGGPVAVAAGVFMVLLFWCFSVFLG